MTKETVKLGDYMLPLEENEKALSNLREFLVFQQINTAAIKEIKTKLEILDDEFSIKYDYNPIHHIEHRLKSPKSIVEKLQRKQLPITIESIRKHITDIAGVRVICNYIEDIYRIADLLTGQNDITLLRVRDYIKEPKPVGYRSLHLIVSIPIFLSESTENIPVEIQIRTIGMDMWASLEHELKYKSKQDIPDSIVTRLRNAAETINSTDLEMQSIFREINGQNK